MIDEIEILQQTLREHSQDCIINEEKTSSKIFINENFTHERGVKKAYGVDAMLRWFSGDNVIQAYMERKLALEDILYVNEKTYRVFEVKEIARSYCEVILYEDDYTHDFTFKSSCIIGETTNRAEFEKDGLHAKGRLMTKESAGVLELPVAFYGDGVEKETHIVTIRYKDEYAKIENGWAIEFENKKLKVLSVLNFNEQNLFLLFNCARVT